MCEIGELVGYPGQVKQVKVLGVMALIDEEETDWKIIVIDINDPLASKLHDIEDVERHLPGLMRATNEWFRIYKIPDGKPENQFAFSGECKNKKYAEEVIKECSEAWEKLISGKTNPGDISLYASIHFLVEKVLDDSRNLANISLIVPTLSSSTTAPTTLRSPLFPRARTCLLPPLTAALTSGSSSPVLLCKVSSLVVEIPEQKSRVLAVIWMAWYNIQLEFPTWIL